MHSLLLVFEFLGTTELLVIAVVALILFGPRKLPEIGRTVGKAIGEFKRASDDFKRTWEYEVELERRKPASEIAGAQAAPAGDAGAASLSSADAAATSSPAAPRPGDWPAAEEFVGRAPRDDDWGAATVARGSSDDDAAYEVGGEPLRRRAAGDDEVNAS